MSHRTLEVVIEDGRIVSSGAESLPWKAYGLLTLIEEGEGAPAQTCAELADWWKKRERLPADEAETFADDIDKGRAELPKLKSPWD